MPSRPRAAEPLRRIDPRLLTATIVTVFFHGGLLASGSHRRTYDAFVHLFFADHYSRDWFSTWEPRWYTGFPTISYPPGVHQLLALSGQLLGPDQAYVVVQLAVAVLLVVGVYRFAAIWTGPSAAGWAALAASVSSSLAEVVHVFGQLPTTAALAFLLHAQPSIRAWVAVGRRGDLVTALALLAATTSVHHVTTLFGSVFFTGPVIARAVLDAFATPLPTERDGHTADVSRRTVVALVARRSLRVTAALRRTVVLGAATISLLIVVILPYWLWSSSDPISQVPIPHGSRDNFLEQPNTGLVFWLVPWASSVLVLPFALSTGVRNRTWPLAASVAVLAVLGTGGTTPIPRMVLGGAFDILTLDRFTVWATVAVLPLAGSVLDRLSTDSPRSLLQRSFGSHAPRILLVTLAVVATGACIFASSLTHFRPTQPDPIDPDPIVAFMEKDDHDRWRYLMLGFGDQMANVSAQTEARTVDGNYHSARRLPELTSHSVERLEGAKFRGVPGLGSLQEFVDSPARYNLKFIFSNDEFYDPMLWASGWQRIGSLDNDVIVWERPDVPPLLAHELRPEIPSWQRLMWGILPLTAIAGAVLALSTLPLRHPTPVPARRFGPVDRWLERRTARLDELPLARARVRYGLHLGLGRLTQHQVAATRITVALTFAIATLSVASTLLPPPHSPEQPVVSYYDHLDFQRFDLAWAELDASTRPSLEEFLTTRSLMDGLIDGYAKLDSLDVTDVEVVERGRTARVTVLIRYLTSVGTHERTATHVVRWDGERWGMEAEAAAVSTTGLDDLSRTLRTDYRIDTTVPSESDRLPSSPNRPRLRLGPTQVLTVGDQWYVAGEVTNIDARPAAITIDITARSADGIELATVNPSDLTAHVARPGETIPFLAPVVRIASRSVSADSSPQSGFDPDVVSSPVVDEPPVSVDVAARAVVATRDLDRDLQLSGLVLDETDGGAINGTLVNAGVETVTIPHVLVTVLDTSGRVAWIQDLWVEEALRPGERTAFTVTLTTPGTRATGTVVNRFADEVGTSSSLPTSFDGAITASIQAYGFLRTEIR